MSAGFLASQAAPEHTTSRVSLPEPQLAEHGDQGLVIQTQPDVALQKSALRGLGPLEEQSASSPEGQRTCRKRMPVPQEVEQFSHGVAIHEQFDLSSHSSTEIGAGDGQWLALPEGHATRLVRFPWPH